MVRSATIAEVTMRVIVSGLMVSICVLGVILIQKNLNA